MEKFRFLALWMSGLMVLIYLVQVLISGFTEAFLLNSALATTEPWRLVTSIFLHGSVSHLASNLFALALFGSLLEKEIGNRRFLIFFFVTGIVASFFSLPFYERALGASGAIFGVLGMLAVLKPKMPIWAFGVPMPMIVAAFFWFLLDLAGTFFPSSVANIAHIAGMISGAIIGFWIRYELKTKKRNPEPKPQTEKKEEKDKEEKSVSEDEFNRWEEEWMG